MKGWKVIVLVVSFLWVLSPFFVSAEMMPLGDDELGEVAAAAGVNIGILNVTFDAEVGGVKYTDTDTGNSVEFNNLKVHDWAGNPVYFDSGLTPILLDLLTVDDAESLIDGRSVFTWENNDWTQLLTFEVENFVFCDQDLGSLEIGNIDMPNSHFYSMHATDGNGIGYQYGLEMEIEEIKWTYNTAPTSLIWTGIHFAQSATGNPTDDPTDPTSWVFTGKFVVGPQFFNNDPAEFHVLSVGPSTHEILDLPMDGSVRIEDLDFAGQGFGPMAIDGITVHRLQIQVPAI